MRSWYGIVAFAFGIPSTLQCNRNIASVAAKKARKLGAPVYTQLDVQFDDDIRTEYTEEVPGQPPPTLRIARGAIAWAQKNGLKELFIVAAAPHMRRAMRDMRYANREAGAYIIIRVCDEVYRYPRSEWFQKDSLQPHTVSYTAWRRREGILDVMPMWLYKRVAS